MIQNYTEISENIHSINENWSNGAQIQKIYSSGRYICLNVRRPGKTGYVYLGRGGGFEGVWASVEGVPAYLRQKDSYLELLRKWLTGKKIVSWSIDSVDRIICLRISGGQFLFFWKGRELFFCFNLKFPDSEMSSFTSWTRNKQTNESEIFDFSIFDEVGRRCVEKQGLSEGKNIEVLLKQEQDAAHIEQVKIEKKVEKKLQRKIINIKEDLSKIDQISSVKEVLSKAENNTDLLKIDLKKMKLKMDEGNSFFKNRDKIYTRIKKMSEAKNLLESRLSQTTKELSEEKIKAPVSRARLIQVMLSGNLLNSEVETVTAVQQNDFIIYKNENWTIAVGNNDHGNDQIRNQWSNPEDIWLHLDSRNSAHAIIKFNKSGNMDMEAIDEAASIIAKRSGFVDEWIPIVFTNVKHIKGVKGKSGLVTLKKEKRLLVKNMMR